MLPRKVQDSGLDSTQATITAQTKLDNPMAAPSMREIRFAGQRAHVLDFYYMAGATTHQTASPTSGINSASAAF